MDHNHEYHIVGPDGAIIISSLTRPNFEHYKNCTLKSEIIKCCFHDGKRKRHGKLTTKNGVIYVISSEKPILSSKKSLYTYLNIYSSILASTLEKGKSLIEGFNKRTRRLLHNLRSINAHNIQELESVIPQHELTDNIFDQVELVKKKYSENSEYFSSCILRSIKNNLAMKVEVNVFDKMFESTPILKIEDYRIDRVLLNVLQTFFQDFTDSATTVKIGQTDKILKLDYETFQVCLYHLFDNASKYILHNKDLAIKFKNDKGDFLIELDMISLKIHNEEVALIMEEGVSGKEAIKVDKHGQGIGMYRVLNLLKLNDSTIELKRNSHFYSKNINGVIYENNVITIRFHRQGSYI